MNLFMTYGIVKGMAMGANADRDGPVRQRSLREHNLGLMLRQVAAEPSPISRADLAARTGLTKATVSALVDQLIGGGLLTEVAPPPQIGAGRPAHGLTLASAGPRASASRSMWTTWPHVCSTSMESSAGSKSAMASSGAGGPPRILADLARARRRDG